LLVLVRRVTSRDHDILTLDVSQRRSRWMS